MLLVTEQELIISSKVTLEVLALLQITLLEGSIISWTELRKHLECCFFFFFGISSQSCTAKRADVCGKHYKAFLGQKNYQILSLCSFGEQG